MFGPGVRAFAIASSLALHAAFLLAVATGGTRAESTPVTQSLPLVAVRLDAFPVQGAKPLKEMEHRQVDTHHDARRHDGPARTAPVAVEHRRGLPLDPPVQPYYYRMSELSEKPAVVHDARPDPALLADAPSDKAILRLMINEFGDIDRVEVVESRFGAEIESALVEAFRQIKFTAGKIDGVPVKSQMRIEVDLDGAPAL